MNGLWLYGAVGVAVAAWLARREGWGRRWSSPAFERRVKLALNPRRAGWGYRFREDGLAPGLTLLAVAVCWPVVLVAELAALLAARRRPPPSPSASSRSEPPRFAVQPEHLRERLTVAQVEARERVDAAPGEGPSRPFGHLHPVWQDFLGQAGGEADEELWSFQAPWSAGYRGLALRSGYVWVRQGVPGAFMLTALRVAQEEQLPGFRV